MKVLDLILRSALLRASRRMKPPKLFWVGWHDPRHPGTRRASLDGHASRYRRARFRRPAPAPDGDARDAWAGVPAGSGERGGAARRRRAGARRRQADRGGGGARAAVGNSRARSAASGAARLASRQPASADPDHAKRPANPARSCHRGNGQGAGRPRGRDRGPVRSRRRRLCPCGARSRRERS
jgi:hypothetical protein